LALRSELLILTNVCPHSLLSHLHVYFGHITHHSYSNQHCFRLQLSAGAHKRAFVTFGDSAYFTAIAGVSSIAFFSPLQEDNVAIAAMNGINIFSWVWFNLFVFYHIET
jgi:hypothetical protein